MIFSTNGDLPRELSSGLVPEVQDVVRSTLNQGNLNGVPEAVAIENAKSMLIESGWAWDGKKWAKPEEVVDDGTSMSLVTKDDSQHVVFGWAKIATTANGKVLVDRQSDAISIDELEKGAYDYVLRSRDGGEMHVNRGVGTMVESMVFTKEKIEKMGLPQGSVHEGWWIGFKIHDDRVWKGVVDGDYTAFSIHGLGRRVPIKVPVENAEYESNYTPQPVDKSATNQSPTRSVTVKPVSNIFDGAGSRKVVSKRRLVW